MSQESSTQRFFAQTGKLTFGDMPHGKLMSPQITYGISEDLPDSFKNTHSLVRRDLSRSPVCRDVRPQFSFNEFSFSLDDKEVFDLSSAKPTSTFDMRNSYRLDNKLRSPYYKEYNKALKSTGFAMKNGMCSTFGEVTAINRSPILRTRRRQKCFSTLPQSREAPSPKAKAKQRKGSPLIVSYEAKKAVRLSAILGRALASEIAETRTNIEKFEETLKKCEVEFTDD